MSKKSIKSMRSRSGKAKGNSKKKTKITRRVDRKKKSANKRIIEKNNSSRRLFDNSKERRETAKFLLNEFNELILKEELDKDKFLNLLWNDLKIESAEYPKVVREEIYSRVLKKDLDVLRYEWYFSYPNYFKINLFKNDVNKLVSYVSPKAISFYRKIGSSWENRYLVRIKYLFEIDGITYDSYYGGEITKIRNLKQFILNLRRMIVNFERRSKGTERGSYLLRYSNMRVYGILVQGYKNETVTD